MGGWGRQNPWPFQWGGGQSAYEKAWKSLRTMLGPKGPGPIGGLEDAWRESKVSGLVKVLTMPERAALQAFPMSATDHLPVYEDELGLSPAPTDQQRRDAASVIWSGALSAIIPELVAALQLIDADFDVLVVNEDKPAAERNDHTACWQWGKALDSPGSGDFGQFPAYMHATAYPNYSTNFVCFVLYSNQDDAAGPDPNKIAEAENVLVERLPGWVNYVILTSVGFLVGTSPIGWTGLGEDSNRELVAKLTVSDSLTVSAWSIEAAASDAVAIVDSVGREADWERAPFSWSAAIDSVLVSAWSVEGVASDSAAVADSTSTEATIGRGGSDSAAVTDSVSRVLL